MKTFWPVAVPVLALTLVCAVVAGVASGWSGATGAVVGGLLVVLFLGSSPWIMGPVAKASPAASLPVAMGLFLVKVVVALLVLAAVAEVGAVRDHVAPRAVGITILLASVLWTTLHVLAFKRSRVLIYDLGDTH